MSRTAITWDQNGQPATTDSGGDPPPSSAHATATRSMARITSMTSGTTNHYRTSVPAARQSFHQYMPGLHGQRRASTANAAARPASHSRMTSQRSAMVVMTSMPTGSGAHDN